MNPTPYTHPRFGAWRWVKRMVKFAKKMGRLDEFRRVYRERRHIGAGPIGAASQAAMAASFEGKSALSSGGIEWGGTPQVKAGADVAEKMARNRKRKTGEWKP